MRRAFVLPPMVLLLAATPVLAPGAGAWIVAFDELPDAASTYEGGTVAAVDERLRAFLVEASDASFEARVLADPNVRWAEPDVEQYHTLATNDTLFEGEQYDLQEATTNVVGAWERTTGATAVHVCVVDTGQFRKHEDLEGASWGPFRDFVRGRSRAYDDNGHGTHVTGTIGAVSGNGRGIAGIAQVTLSGAKVLSRAGTGYNSALANGIIWCADQGAHVVSLSVGGGHSTAVAEAVEYAHAKGALVVAAAGNDGPCDDCVAYPAALPLALAVGCTDAQDATCSFSSTGPEVDIAAPGKDIVSTYPPVRPCPRRETDCYLRLSGTSMSTPHVSGVAALVLSNEPGLTNDELRERLLATAKDVGAPGFDEETGVGIVRGEAVR